MSQGREFLKRVNEALNEFEQAVVSREHKGITQSKVALQQEVDRARDAVVKTVVDIVTETRLQTEQS